MLRLLTGLAEPTRGDIAWSGEKPKFGFVFQEPTLMPWSDVFTNVWLPLRLAGISKDKARPRVEEALASVGLANFAKSYPRQLSGGMKMRVSIARALVTRPSVLLMDEPFAALDEITRLKLNDDLAELQSSLSATVVFVTHSVFESVYLADRIVVMAARPGRAFAEINVEAPPIRREGFRLTATYAETCRRTSAALHEAMGEAPPPSFANEPGRLRRLRGPGAYARLRPALLGVGGALLPDPALSAAGAERHHHDAVHRLGHALDLALGHAVDHAEGADRRRVGSVALAVIFAQSRLVERAFYPFAVALQVTPIVAIAPLLLIYLNPSVAVLVCAFLVAFFPLLANTTLGLSSADHNLVDLFSMYRASKFQQFSLLRLPAALPYFWRA